MTDLTPVGLSKDGKTLVLVSARGDEFRVKNDQRLRAALKGEARSGQLEMTMESTLRPRDIQTRIRAGESAETVATAAGTTVDRIMPYAGPVLAERAHVAQIAQASSIRRRSEGGTGPRTLADAAAVHLRSLKLHDEDVEWDAWRREDGRWTLVADYMAGEELHHAEFVYDMRGRFVTAEDDEARLLTGEMQIAKPEQRSRSGRRLSAVPTQDELPLGDDAIELVADHGDADWIAPDHAHTHDEPIPSEQEKAKAKAGPAAEPEADSSEPEPASEPESKSASIEPEKTAETEASADQAEDDSAETEEPVVPKSRPRKKGRASVPSWDEIMFGGTPE